MMVGSFLFKQKAREALKGNWQTALVVSFFTSVLLTAAQVAQSVALKNVQAAVTSLQMMMGTLGAELTNAQSQQLAELSKKLIDAILSIPDSTYALLLGLHGIALLVTPMLAIGCNYYFISLIKGRNIGVMEGLFGRASTFLKAIWLHVRMFVQIFLWSLLLVVPGVIAALRYSMATYFLAEDPSLSAGEALRLSKAAMKDKGRKPSFFMLQISFVGWSLLISFAQVFLAGMLGPVIMLVAAQFMSLALTVYINASSAAFYYSVSSENGLGDLFATMRRRMRSAGISDDDIRQAGFGNTDDDILIDEDEFDDDESDGSDDE